MEASELRIGNYISHQDGTLCTVEPVHLVRPLDLSNGIPINKQWLKELGFTQCPTTSRTMWLKRFDKVNYYNISDMYEDGWSIQCWHWQLCVNLKYVHQLQNLYFALTGEELKKII